MITTEKMSKATRDKIIACQIYYLELLKKYNALEAAMTGKLPPDVHRAAMTVAVSRFSDIPYDEKNGVIQVEQDLQDEIDKEIEQFLIHYKMAKQAINQKVVLMPRVFIRGKKYGIKSGQYRGMTFINQGTDAEVYGIPWMENADNPACNKYVFRIEMDGLPLDGNVYVGQIGAKNALIHESEIGEVAV